MLAQIVAEVANFAHANGVVDGALLQLLLDRQHEPLGEVHGEATLVSRSPDLTVNF